MAKRGPKSVDDSKVLVIAQNKKARHDYEIVQTEEAGIVLKGSEVKSIRAGGVNIKESYVTIRNREAFLIGANISPFSQSQVDAHDPLAERKLLLNRKEIDRFLGLTAQKGLSIIPLRIYFREGKCKIEIALGKGKKLYDKRESLKEKQVERKIRRAMNISVRES